VTVLSLLSRVGYAELIVKLSSMTANNPPMRMLLSSNVSIWSLPFLYALQPEGQQRNH
jgi:hypothetical protein